jgi:hypothetical protein
MAFAIAHILLNIFNNKIYSKYNNSYIVGLNQC